MKLTEDRPYAEPDKAARRLLDHARAFEPVQDGRIYIEKINGPFLSETGARRQSIGPRSNARLRWAGSKSIGAARSSASRRPAAIYSHDRQADTAIDEDQCSESATGHRSRPVRAR